MGAVLWIRVRAQWRQRWPSMLALMLLVGMVGMVALGSFAGALRTRSVIDREIERSNPFTYFAAFRDESFASADLVLALPEVESGDRINNFFLFAERGFVLTVASVDGKLGVELNRPRIIAGRAPAKESADEVALAEPVAAELGVGIGDPLVLYSTTPEQLGCLTGDALETDPKCAFLADAFNGAGANPEAFEGPVVRLRVVGLTRSLGDVSARPGDFVFTILPPAFNDRYSSVLGHRAAVALRARPGVTADSFAASVRDVLDEGVIADAGNSTAAEENLRSTMNVLANALVAFGAVTAAVGLVAIGQAFSRQARLMLGERSTLVALGCTSPALMLEAIAGFVPVVIGGGGLAIIGATVGSRWMPTGLARRIEPNPGLQFDAVVAVGGVLVVVTGVIVATVAVVVASRPTRHRAFGARRPAFALHARGGVAAWLGQRFATDRRRSVPTGSAFVGVAAGVAGLVAVSVFGGSLDRLVDDPARSGWNWDVAFLPSVEGDGVIDGALQVAADPGVEGVAVLQMGLQLEVEGRLVQGVASRSVEGGLDVVVVEGRDPQSAIEVALGAKTMNRIDRTIGDTVRVQGVEMTIVGQVLFPATTDGYPMADGALVTLEASDRHNFDELTTGSWTTIAVRFADDTDQGASLDRLEPIAGSDTTIATRPQEIDQLRQVRTLPRLLAAFLFLIALLAVGHALTVTVRQRRRDLATVRSLGATPNQARAAIAWQASILCTAGAIVGLPLGVLLGRVLWAVLARSYGVSDSAAVPTVVLFGVLPVSVLLANLLAYLPGRRAATLRPALFLGGE